MRGSWGATLGCRRDRRWPSRAARRPTAAPLRRRRPRNGVSGPRRLVSPPSSDRASRARGAPRARHPCTRGRSLGAHPARGRGALARFEGYRGRSRPTARSASPRSAGWTPRPPSHLRCALAWRAQSGSVPWPRRAGGRVLGSRLGRDPQHQGTAWTLLAATYSP